MELPTAAVLVAGLLVSGCTSPQPGTTSPAAVIPTQPAPTSPAAPTSPSPSAWPTSSPTEIVSAVRGFWVSIGTRVSPFGNPGSDVFNVSETALRIEQFHGPVLSTLSVSSDGRLVVRFEHGVLGLNSNLHNQQWTCDVGALGTYDVALSPDRGTMTLGLVSDPCAPRAAFLPGPWTRSVCPAGGWGGDTCTPEP